MSRVEETRHEDAEILLQPLHVVIRPVHHLERVRIRERASEGVAHSRPQRQDVDDEIALARTDLHQTRKSFKRPVRVMFEIRRKLFTLLQMLSQSLQLFGRLHNLERVVVVHRRRQRRRRHRAREERVRVDGTIRRRLRVRLVTLVPHGFRQPEMVHIF